MPLFAGKRRPCSTTEDTRLMIFNRQCLALLLAGGLLSTGQAQLGDPSGGTSPGTGSGSCGSSSSSSSSDPYALPPLPSGGAGSSGTGTGTGSGTGTSPTTPGEPTFGSSSSFLSTEPAPATTPPPSLQRKQEPAAEASAFTPTAPPP